MSKHDLDVIYKQNLESSIIEYVAKDMNITVREAMDYYYSSKLSEQIQSGENGIENLDYKYLANDLMENEKLIAKQ